MTPESTLLALLVGALAWYGRSRRDTAGRLGDRRPAPLVERASPDANGSPQSAVSVAAVDEAPAPDARVDEANAVVPPAPNAEVRTAAPVTHPASPSEPAALPTVVFPTRMAELELDVSRQPEVAATAHTPAPRPLTPTASADAGDGSLRERGSARSLPDGSPPDPDYPIKGNASSMLFHLPTSPYYKRTKAEVWFRTADDARAAGFTEWTPRKRAQR